MDEVDDDDDGRSKTQELQLSRAIIASHNYIHSRLLPPDFEEERSGQTLLTLFQASFGQMGRRSR